MKPIPQPFLPPLRRELLSRLRRRTPHERLIWLIEMEESLVSNQEAEGVDTAAARERIVTYLGEIVEQLMSGGDHHD